MPLGVAAALDVERRGRQVDTERDSVYATAGALLIQSSPSIQTGLRLLLLQLLLLLGRQLLVRLAQDASNGGLRR